MRNYKYAVATAMAAAMISLVGCVAPVVEMTKTVQGVKEIRNSLDVRP